MKRSTQLFYFQDTLPQKGGGGSGGGGWGVREIGREKGIVTKEESKNSSDFCGLPVSPAPCWDDRCADDVMQKGDRVGRRSYQSAGEQSAGGASTSEGQECERWSATHAVL